MNRVVLRIKVQFLPEFDLHFHIYTYKTVQALSKLRTSDRINELIYKFHFYTYTKLLLFNFSNFLVK